MVSQTDPNQVRLTGENSFIRLHAGDGGPMTTRVSHWRVLYSPVGGGHALFIKSDANDDQVKVYSDNIALARWLQEEIEVMLFPEFADQDIPVIPAEFEREGDTFSFYTEYVESEDEDIVLTWYDFIEPFVIDVPPGTVAGRPLGVYSCFVPARRAQITIDGDAVSGKPLPEMRGDRQSSTAVLAWSETWVKPRL
jgi:hypothetical protein